MVSDKKVSEMEVRIDKMSVLDKIQLHKKTRDIIYLDLLIMKINKLQALVDKLEVQLKHEKLENKENLIKIKKLQTDVISLGSEPGNAEATNKSLEEKYNTIQVLKRS